MSIIYIRSALFNCDRCTNKTSIRVDDDAEATAPNPVGWNEFYSTLNHRDYLICSDCNKEYEELLSTFLSPKGGPA